MPVVAAAVNPNRQSSAPKRQAEAACALQVRARLVSLNGGVVLAVCILLTAFFVATLLTNRLATAQAALFGILTFAGWLYLLDGASERLSLTGDALVRSSWLGRGFTVKLDDVAALLLVHEGLNQEVGIESVTARYKDGRIERLPLGPCWRRRDLEAFLRSVEQAMGNAKLLEEVR